jgi:hypothetical protein
MTSWIGTSHLCSGAGQPRGKKLVPRFSRGWEKGYPRASGPLKLRPLRAFGKTAGPETAGEVLAFTPLLPRDQMHKAGPKDALLEEQQLAPTAWLAYAHCRNGAAPLRDLQHGMAFCQP